MKNVAVVYWSGTGNTQMMAEAVAAGAKERGAQVALLTPDKFSPDAVDSYDSFAFGCPAMGAEVLEETEFQPMWDSVVGKLSGKSVGLFGSYGWGDGEWMRTWEGECRAAGINLAYDCVLCCGSPDSDCDAELRAMGAALA